MRTEEKTDDAVAEECFIGVEEVDDNLDASNNVKTTTILVHQASCSSDEDTASISSSPSVSSSEEDQTRVPDETSIVIEKENQKTNQDNQQYTSHNNKDTYPSLDDETTTQNYKNNSVSASVNNRRTPNLKLDIKAANARIDSADITSGSPLPECLKNLLAGLNVPGDSNCSIESKPDWLDMEKFRKGQQFANNHISGLNWANLLSLFIGFSFRRLFEPLIFSGNSDTPFKSFKRYLSTVNRLSSWYQGNIWDTNDPAHKNIRAVRLMHRNVMKRINSLPPDKLDRMITLKGADGNSNGMWCSLTDTLHGDFSESCPVSLPGSCPYGTFANSGKGSYYISQFDMAITQFEFVGLMILYPKKFGAHGASDEDLEAFIHFWRAVGYVLGIEDKYNFCKGNLEETRELTDSIIRYWVKPNLRDISQDTEHMFRCIVEGISYYMRGLTVKPVLMYTCWVLGISARRLSSTLSWFEYFVFKYFQFNYLYISRLPGVNAFNNWYVKSRIKYANNRSPSWLEQRQNKVYPYQVSTGDICTKL